MFFCWSGYLLAQSQGVAGKAQAPLYCSNCSSTRWTSWDTFYGFRIYLGFLFLANLAYFTTYILFETDFLVPRQLLCPYQKQNYPLSSSLSYYEKGHLPFLLITLASKTISILFCIRSKPLGLIQGINSLRHQ